MYKAKFKWSRHKIFPFTFPLRDMKEEPPVPSQEFSLECSLIKMWFSMSILLIFIRTAMSALGIHICNTGLGKILEEVVSYNLTIQRLFATKLNSSECLSLKVQKNRFSCKSSSYFAIKNYYRWRMHGCGYIITRPPL